MMIHVFVLLREDKHTRLWILMHLLMNVTILMITTYLKKQEVNQIKKSKRVFIKLSLNKSSQKCLWQVARSESHDLRQDLKPWCGWAEAVLTEMHSTRMHYAKSIIIYYIPVNFRMQFK